MLHNIYIKINKNDEIREIEVNIDEYIELIKNKDKEIKRLKQYIKTLEENEDYLKKGFADLYKRIDDAIEYANSIPTQKVIRIFKKEILDILNGDSDDR